VAALTLLPLAAVTTTTSIATAADVLAPKTATLRADENRVRYGDTVRLSGAVGGAADVPVKVSFNPAGEGGWHGIRRTRTGAGGGFAVRLPGHETGKFRAQPKGGNASGNVRVRVRSLTHADARSHGVVGDGVPVEGRVRPGNSGRHVVVHVDGHSLDTHTGRHGHFRVVWHPQHTGRYHVRVEADGDKHAKGSADGAGHVTVFRPAMASWYGPGMYGSTTACGQTLTAGTLGVAHKTMPCGTKLTLRYHGRQVRVQVIDRGPYVAGREFDLTQATKDALGFGSTGEVLTSK
jgi:hypothetical protein